MKCSNCGLPTDDGAAYCGNCGQGLEINPLQVAYAAAAGNAGVPSYAFARPLQHQGAVMAVLSLALGIMGLIGALFVALAGIGLGMAGLVLGTLSHRGARRGISLAGIIVSSIAVLVSICVWCFVLVHGQQTAKAADTKVNALNSSQAVAANSVTTPCYEAGFTTMLNVSTPEGSCDMQAFNGSSLASSSNAYKVYGYHQPSLQDANFMAFAKQAIEQDVRDNLAGFTVDKASVGQFAGSPAYIVNASNKANGVAYVEAAVLHAGSQDNVFVFVHAVTANATDLNGVESQWQWK